MGTLIFIGVIFGALAVFGWTSGMAQQIKENEENKKIRLDLEEREKKHRIDLKALQVKEQDFLRLKQAFDTSYISGRKWLAEFIAESQKSRDDEISFQLEVKKRPALVASQEVRAAKAEKRDVSKKLKFLEYQLKSYKEYFPFLEEYEDAILGEAVDLTESENGLDALEEADPVLKFVEKNEYERLPSAVRNQLALDRYLRKPFSQSGIGRFYERYLGYRYEVDGWSVRYQGIIDGYEDLGRDLICSKGDKVHIVQAKCWSINKKIHEKHVFQLFGTLQLFKMDLDQFSLFDPKIKAVLVTSTVCSDIARKAASLLKIELRENTPLEKTYPLIKCNVGKQSREKIYHLPFDQQYDRVIITPSEGEYYVKTAAEAENLGFRRAYRYRGLSRQGAT